MWTAASTRFNRNPLRHGRNKTEAARNAAAKGLSVFVRDPFGSWRARPSAYAAANTTVSPIVTCGVS